MQPVDTFSFLQVIPSVIQSLYTIFRIHPVPYSVLAPQEKAFTQVLNADHCQMENDPAHDRLSKSLASLDFII